MPMIFSDFEKHLGINEFNHDFLVSYHSKLREHLMKIFYMEKSTIECFLFIEFEYSECDWNSGKRWSVPLRDHGGLFPREIK